MVRLIATWLGAIAAMLIPSLYARWAKIGDDHEVVYILHIGLQWLGYGAMMSLSFTDFKSNIHKAMEDLDA
jgi:hypothetical protein